MNRGTHIMDRYLNFYRKYLSLNSRTWQYYIRYLPLSGLALKNVSHPLFGGLLRRLFLFEGPGRLSQSHILPIQKEIKYKTKQKGVVLPTEMLRRAIEEASYRIIMNRCICRDGYGCNDFPRDFGCIMLGEACRNMVGRDIARQATVEECFAHLEKASEKGLTAIAAWAEFETIVKGIPDKDHKNYFEICFCCPCCCLGMRHYKEMLKSDHMRKIFKSIGYQAQATEACTACGLCINACPLDIITIDTGKATMEQSCIGCGLCATHCPQKAIVMTETIPIKDNLLDYFEGFRPQIRG